MPFYRISFIYKLANKGWTETYYREANSAREASDFGGAVGLTPWLQLRTSPVILQAIRAQELDGLKRMFLRLCWLPGTKILGTPDVTSTMAHLHIPFQGGSHRRLDFRGLDDFYVQRNTAGQDTPGPGFMPLLADLNQRFRELDLRGQRLVKHPEHLVASFGLHPDSELLTLVTLRYPGVVAQTGQYVDFGGGRMMGLVRGRGYLVIDSQPGFLTLLHPWDPDMADWNGGGKIWVRHLEYEYPRLGDLQFAGFDSHKTGPAYKPVSWAASSPWRAPISPCGRIVDFVRQAYTVDMALFRYDTSITNAVKWYYPEILPQPRRGLPTRIEEIPAVPFEHPFGSRLWEIAGDFLPSLGERKERRKYSGRPLALVSGIGLCGSLDAWMNGAGINEPQRPLNATTGQPCCCGPGALVLRGGAVAGGKGRGGPAIRGGAVAGGRRKAFAAIQGGAVAGGEPPPAQTIQGGAVGGGEQFIPEQSILPSGGVVVGQGLKPAELIFDCGACTEGAYDRYRVTMTGATDSAAVWNGFWVLTASGACEWSKVFVPDVHSAFLFLGAGVVTVVLQAPGASNVHYVADLGADCLGPWTLAKDPIFPSGPEWPETITVTHV